MFPERLRVYVCPACGYADMEAVPEHSSDAGRCDGVLIETVYGLVLVGAGPVGSTRPIQDDRRVAR